MKTYEISYFSILIANIIEIGSNPYLGHLVSRLNERLVRCL